MTSDPITPSIQCDAISKRFRIHEKEEGILGSLRSFFHRSYREVHAVENFSFEVYPNEIVGLLGPNGAGKTTLIKMLTGIIVPSEGSAKVLGYQPDERARPFRKKIALVMGQKSQLWWDIPAYDSLQLLQRYYELDGASFKERVGVLSELFQVTDLLHIHVRRLSLGERMKLELMACLLHEPEVIFLDEPTIGLDVVAQRNIREYIKEYHTEHKTSIILTSHYMADVQALANRLVLILGGKKRFDGTLKEFENLFGSEKYVLVEFLDAPNRGDSFWQQLNAEWSESGRAVELRIPEERFSELSQEIFKKGAVTHFSTEQLPIERVMTSLLENPHLIPENS